MKYVGSKSRISKEIAPIIQTCIENNNINIYYEPFLGGANMMSCIKCEKRIGNDIDNLPIDLIKAGLADSDNLFDSLPNPYPTKEHYYIVRDNPNNYDKGYRAAILLFASYNARVYGGCYGAFANTKDGLRNYFREAMNNFKKQLPSLYGIELYNGDYLNVDLNYSENAMIYCDPPYSDGIGYKNTFDSKMFWEWVRKQSKNNYVLVSEYDAPEDFVCVWEKEIKTHMNNRGKLMKTEKLFLYKYGKYAEYIEKGENI